MKLAGYIEKTINYQGYTKNVYKDEKGRLIDIVRIAEEMYEKDPNWINLAYKVTSVDLTEDEVNIIIAQTEALVRQFLKNRKK